MMMNNEEESRLRAKFEREFKKRMYEQEIGPRYIKIASISGGFIICDTVEKRPLGTILGENDVNRIIQALNFTEDSINALKLLIVKEDKNDCA